MKLNNRFIFGILSLVLAAVIAFVALPTIARQTNGKTEIVRITQPVLKGEQVTKENAEVVEVGGYNLPTNVAHSLEDALIAMLTPLFAPPAQSMAVTAVPRANISISVIAGRLVMPM